MPPMASVFRPLLSFSAESIASSGQVLLRAFFMALSEGNQK